jgi:hypothetical protein
MMLSDRVSLCDMSIMEVAAGDHPPDRTGGHVHKYEACWIGSNLHIRNVLSLPFGSILDREISAQRPPLENEVIISSVNVVSLRFEDFYLPFYQEDVVMGCLLSPSVCRYTVRLLYTVTH